MNTAATPHTGSIVTAGPARTGISGGPGTGGGQNGGGRPGGQGQPPGQNQNGTGSSTRGNATRGGGMGGLINGANVSSQLLTMLTTDADGYTWVAATTGAQNAASYQLASGSAVMAIGGFNGSDPSPTLEQFQAYVAAGRIHYFIGGGNFGGQNGGSNAAS